jgi:uncharacterized membrane protein YphA (DoxX/SURF4 family)
MPQVSGRLSTTSQISNVTHDIVRNDPSAGTLEARMLPLTSFLAKLLGLNCVILALAMMTRKQSTVTTIKALIRNPPLLLFVEGLSLAGGLAMVIGHNIWSGSALPVVITLLGWLMVIRGGGLLAGCCSADSDRALVDAPAAVTTDCQSLM